MIKYILSRDSLRKELENTRREGVEGIEHYVDLISKSPHTIYDREIVASLKKPHLVAPRPSKVRA